MKKLILFLSVVLLGGFFISASVSLCSAQTKNPKIMMYFERQSNGKVAQLNAAKQKEFNFFIEGLTTQTDIDNFTSKFTNNKLVASIKITDVLPDGQRKGKIIMDQTAKLPTFQELLKSAGVYTISINGELKSVDELGKDKKAANKK
jgi:hypothetical protein